MVSSIRALGNTLMHIRKAIDSHSQNLSNINTEGYIAKDGGFSTIKSGGVKYHERKPTPRASADAHQLYLARIEVESNRKVANLYRIAIMPLNQNVQDSVAKSISNLNYNYNLKTSEEQTIGRKIVAGNLRLAIDDYKAKLKSWSMVTGTDPTIMKQPNGSGLLIDGFKKLDAAFTEFTNEINSAFGTTIISGGIHNATVDETAIGEPVTSNIKNTALSYNTSQSITLDALESKSEFNQEIYTARHATFEKQYGVNIEEEIVTIVALQNQYNAVAKIIRVKDEMFQSLLDIKR